MVTVNYLTWLRDQFSSLETSTAVDVMVIMVLTQVQDIRLTQLARHSDVNFAPNVALVQEYGFVLI
jgi:hypothetical protein